MMESAPLLSSHQGNGTDKRHGLWRRGAMVLGIVAACVVGGFVIRHEKMGAGLRKVELLTAENADDMQQIMAQKMSTHASRTTLDAYFDRELQVEELRHTIDTHKDMAPNHLVHTGHAAHKTGDVVHKNSVTQSTYAHESGDSWRFAGRSAQGVLAPTSRPEAPPSFDDMVTRRIFHADKVKIGFYMESECPGCRMYTRKIISKLMRIPEFNNMVELTVYPYGNGHLSGNTITCQHGPEECMGNKVVACMQAHRKVTDSDPEGFIPAMECVMSRNQPPELIYADCTSKFNIDYDAVRTCVYGEEGEKLVLDAAIATESLVPAHEWSPWITVNGKPCRDAAWDLWPTVCEEYKGPRGEMCQQVLENTKDAQDASTANKKEGGSSSSVLQQHAQMRGSDFSHFTVCDKTTGAELPMPQ